MSLPLQTLKKIGVLMVTSLMPLIVFLILFLLGVNLLIAGITAILIALIFVIISHKFTDTPFLRIWEGKSFGCLAIDSRGIIDIFDVKLEGDNFIANFMGNQIKTPFNANFFWRMADFFRRGTLKEKEEKLVLTLEKKDFPKSLFKTSYPFLIWNKQLKTFITKDWLHDHERKDMWFTKAFEIKQEIREFNKSATSITKVIVDMIGAKTKQTSWIIWIILILVIGYLLYTFWPTIEGVLSGALGSTTKAVESASTSLPEKLA